jgi:hypothetical protein
MPVSGAFVRFTNKMRLLLQRWDLLVPFRRLGRAITFSSRGFVFVMPIVPKDDIDPHAQLRIVTVGKKSGTDKARHRLGCCTELHSASASGAALHYLTSSR